MKPVVNKNNWLGQRMDSLSDEELQALFFDISEFRRLGVLIEESLLRKLDREFQSAHTLSDTNLRLMEDAVLFEIGRRWFNAKCSG